MLGLSQQIEAYARIEDWSEIAKKARSQFGALREESVKKSEAYMNANLIKDTAEKLCQEYKVELEKSTREAENLTTLLKKTVEKRDALQATLIL